MTSTPRSARQRGFTLAELAIVFVIVALLIGGTVLTLSAQTEGREITDTQRTLDQARDATIGFALRNGRLPCPATNGGNDISGVPTTPSNGRESFCPNIGPGACGSPNVFAAPAHGRCSNPNNGFVPAATLGIGPIEANALSPNVGLLLDSWLQPVRYSASQVLAPAPSSANTMLFTAAGEMKNHLLTSPPVAPDLAVCTQRATVSPGVTCDPGVPTFQTPAVVY
ncbi:MAG: type II secretion system protein, partial [Gammaproteobacteria bacterium]